MLGNVNFNLVPNRLPETSEGLYEGFEDEDEEDGWGSEDQDSQDSNEGEVVEEGPPAAMTVGEEDGDDVDAMDVTDTAPTNGIEGRGQKRSLEESES